MSSARREGFFSFLLTILACLDTGESEQGVLPSVFLAQQASTGRVRMGFFRFSGGFLLIDLACLIS